MSKVRGLTFISFLAPICLAHTEFLFFCTVFQENCTAPSSELSNFSMYITRKTPVYYLHHTNTNRKLAFHSFIVAFITSKWHEYEHNGGWRAMIMQCMCVSPLHCSSIPDSVCLINFALLACKKSVQFDYHNTAGFSL